MISPSGRRLTGGRFSLTLMAPDPGGFQVLSKRGGAMTVDVIERFVSKYETLSGRAHLVDSSESAAEVVLFRGPRRRRHAAGRGRTPG